MSQGQISDDGMWRWDGQRWVPNQPQQRPSGPPNQPQQPPSARTPNSSNRVRNVGIAGAGALAALVALILILVTVSGGGTRSGTSSPTPGNGGSPEATNGGQQASCKQPCAEKDGVTLRVTEVNPDATPTQFFPVQPNNKLVTVTTEVTNQSSSNPPLVNPFDFKLQDSAGTQHSTAVPGSAEGCNSSSVNVAKGGTSGPQCYVFEVPQDKTKGMTLLWRKIFDTIEVKLP